MVDSPAHVSVSELLARHQAVLLDAYGVLVDAHGPLAGASEFIDSLNNSQFPYVLVTNDASRLPTTMAARFRSMGLAIDADRIVSSGDLLGKFIKARDLVGRRCVVLGPPDSEELVRRAGGIIVTAGPKQFFDALIIGDESGYDFLSTIDDTLSMVIAALDRGESPHLVVPNPDLIYPKRSGEFGIAAGSIAEILERALAQRFQAGWLFTRLGKPHAPIFEEACARLGTRDAVMVGDQLHTDIQGANDFGIASALLGSGIARLDLAFTDGPRPTYVLTSLDQGPKKNVTD